MEVAKERNEIWHKGSLGNENGARTSNIRIAQRKRAIPHATMKNMTYVTVNDVQWAKIRLTALNTPMS